MRLGNSRQKARARWVRLMQLAERDPRRSGRIALQWAGGERTAYDDLAIGWALLRWERLAAAATALDAAAAALPLHDHAARLQCQRAQLMLAQLQDGGPELQARWEAHLAACAAAGVTAAILPARCEQLAHLNLLGRYSEARDLAARLSDTEPDTNTCVSSRKDVKAQRVGAPLLEPARLCAFALKQADRALQARFLHVCGVAAIGCGELAMARQLLDQAGKLFQQLGRRAELARVAFELGWLAIRSEQLSTAAQALQWARTIYQRLELPFRVALCERDLGTVAYLQNDYGQALTWGVTARSQFLALGRDSHAAGCDFNLGTVAHVCGLYDLAMAVYQRAEQTYLECSHTFHAFVAGRNQVLVACAQGKPAQALALADALAAQGEALGDALGACELLDARARALRGLGRTSEAAQSWITAARRFDELGNRGGAVESRLELAWLQLEAGELAAAERLLKALAPDLAARPAQLWRVHYGLGLIAARRGALAAAHDAYLSAVKLVAAMRRRLASEHASSGIFRQAQALHDAALKLAAQLEDHAALLLLVDSQHSLSLEYQFAQARSRPDTAALREAAGVALRQALIPRQKVKGASQNAAPSVPGSLDVPTHATVSSVHPESQDRNPQARIGQPTCDDAAQRDAALEQYLTALLQTRHGALSAPQPLEPCDPALLCHELTAAYGSAWTLLCPLFTAEDLLLVGVTPEESFCTRQPYDPQLRQLLDRACLPSQRQMTYRDLGRLRHPELPAWQVLSALGDLLLPPWLTARLAPQHRLLIVPSGPLHGLAWAALRVGGAWLCEQSLLTLLPSLRAARTPPRLDRAAPALLLGCSDFGTRAPSLPLVGATLDIVACAWPGPTTQLRDLAATVAALREANAQQSLRRYGLIHLASHAQLGAADGLLAQIQFADDAMFLDEVAQLRLAADLVVLTACEGGAGAVLTGDEVLSLSRALLTAGARSVLASLWTVYDQGVLALLEPLYQALAAGHDAATALAHAQRTLCVRPAEDGSMLHTPYSWGGFYVVCR